MPALKPEILFEDPHLAVLSKPAGLLSQGDRAGEPNLVDYLRTHFGRHYVGLVHRLDRNTSGLMVVAKRSKSAQRLTDALQAGKIYRAYLGWVEGVFYETQRWSHRLLKDEEKNRVRVISISQPQGKEAVLSARPIRHGRRKECDLTLVEFVLETGRSHQIRAQSSYEGFPLLGDRKYGARVDFPRTALHSHVLRFDHPMGGREMKFESALPKDLSGIK